MSSATAITWAFNFLISFTWPELMNKFSPTGGFCWYAAWNVFGWIFAWFLLPETKNRTLEELDSVFSMKNRDHAGYHAQYLHWKVSKMCGRDVDPMLDIYETHAETSAEAPENLEPKVTGV
jgi:hypothetical protein